MEEVTIPYKPRVWAIKVHESEKRWMVLVLHRRAGKTTAALNHLQRDALKINNSYWGYIAPTYKQAKRIAWDMIKFYAKVIPGVEFNESELMVKYPNGSKLTLFGADTPDSLRGLGFWGVIFDEYSQQPSNIFTEIIRPALADHSGYAIWIGTPKGRNDFHRLYQRGLRDEDWFSLLLTVDDTKLIPINELLDARKLMLLDEYNQEFMCSFDAAVKGAYYSEELEQLRKDNRLDFVPYDKALKVHTVSDLGVGPHFATGFYQRVGEKLKKIDYNELSGSQGIPSFVKMLQNKPCVYGKHFFPQDILGTDMATEKTRKELLESLGIEVTLVPKHYIDDGITKGRLLFNRLWVDEKKCRMWIDYIAQYKQEWDENKGMFKNTPYHDFTSHAADEYRYAAMVEDQMTNEEVKEFKQPSDPPPQTEWEGTIDPTVGKEEEVIDHNDFK